MHVPGDKVLDSIPDNTWDALEEANHFYIECIRTEGEEEQLMKSGMLPGDHKKSVMFCQPSCILGCSLTWNKLGSS